MKALVLVIEDNHGIRENVSELLELEGYKVIVAENGNTGIDLAREQMPAIILCDVMMPGITGFEVHSILRSDPATASIPFVFLTANAERKEVEKGLAMGAGGYIKKPFETEELYETVRLCLEKK